MEYFFGNVYKIEPLFIFISIKCRDALYHVEFQFPWAQGTNQDIVINIDLDVEINLLIRFCSNINRDKHQHNHLNPNHSKLL